jgi:hypothetical protein
VDVDGELGVVAGAVVGGDVDGVVSGGAVFAGVVAAGVVFCGDVAGGVVATVPGRLLLPGATSVLPSVWIVGLTTPATAWAVT